MAFQMIGEGEKYPDNISKCNLKELLVFSIAKFPGLTKLNLLSGA